MLGRGLLANPALVRMAAGGAPATATELRHLHDRLFCEYEKDMGANVVFRMKEWWFYTKCAFENPLAVHRMVRKVRKVDEYLASVERIFSTQQLAQQAVFH